MLLKDIKNEKEISLFRFDFKIKKKRFSYSRKWEKT